MRPVAVSGRAELVVGGDGAGATKTRTGSCCLFCARVRVLDWERVESWATCGSGVGWRAFGTGEDRIEEQVGEQVFGAQRRVRERDRHRKCARVGSEHRAVDALESGQIEARGEREWAERRTHEERAWREAQRRRGEHRELRERQEECGGEEHELQRRPAHEQRRECARDCERGGEQHEEDVRELCGGVRTLVQVRVRAGGTWGTRERREPDDRGARTGGGRDGAEYEREEVQRERRDGRAADVETAPFAVARGLLAKRRRALHANLVDRLVVDRDGDVVLVGHREHGAHAAASAAATCRAHRPASALTAGRHLLPHQSLAGRAAFQLLLLIPLFVAHPDPEAHACAALGLYQRVAWHVPPVTSRSAALLICTPRLSNNVEAI